MKKSEKLKKEEKKKDTIFIIVSIILLGIILIITSLVNFIFPSLEAEAYHNVPVDLGMENASGVQIIVYSDFKCPFCGSIQTDLKKLKLLYEDKVNFVFKHFPIEQLHAGSQLSAEAAECASQQGMFWAYHDLLFKTPETVLIDQFIGLADELGMDKESFKDCIVSGDAKEKVNADFEEGRAIGIQGTPTFIIEDEMYQGAMPFDEFKNIIDEKIQKENSK